MATASSYPSDLQRDLTLADGRTVRLRPIRPDDEPRLVDLYSRLSAHSAYHRFFTIMRRLPPDWAHFLANVDYRRRLALVAEVDAGGHPQLVGVARWEPSTDGGPPEVAFVVQDDWQNQGLGTALFHALLQAAAARGITTFRAYVLADNRRMLDMLARHTDIRERRRDQAMLELIFTPRS